MPNGIRITTFGSRPDGRSEQLTTDHDLQTGPAPTRVPVSFFANDKGLTGDDVNFFPPDGSLGRIPNRAVIQRTMHQTSRRGMPSFDDTALITAFSSGDNALYGR